MVNSADFAKRLEKILNEYDLSAAAFAQKLQIGRASISHIISGRNKPSLDVVMRIVETFPEVDMYWLLNGKGSFPKTINSTTTTDVEIPNPTLHKPLEVSKQSRKEIDKIISYWV